MAPPSPPVPRAPLSVVVITRNAADQLADCLASVAFADEVVVLDSGSSDGTVDLARRLGARVETASDWPGFGPQKQRAVGLARHDWVLCLDADERLSPQLQAAIPAVLAGTPAHAVWRMARANRFLGRFLRHGEGYPDWSVRLFRRDRARWSDDAVHEKVVTTEPVGTLAGDLLHESAESLEAYLAKQNRYTTLQAEALAARGASATWVHVALSPLVRFVKFYLLRLGFLDGLPGLVHIGIGCFNSMIKYAKLRALAQEQAARRRA
ncbi:MAG: glycosyltransferase family 2 protein [Burkholderiales bacterium]|nr:glycosyltransferase family 2 protein [Burkholderiales bacterium]